MEIISLIVFIVGIICTVVAIAAIAGKENDKADCNLEECETCPFPCDRHSR